MYVWTEGVYVSFFVWQYISLAGKSHLIIKYLENSVIRYSRMHSIIVGSSWPSVKADFYETNCSANSPRAREKSLALCNFAHSGITRCD